MNLESLNELLDQYKQENPGSDPLKVTFLEFAQWHQRSRQAKGQGIKKAHLRAVR